MKILSKDKNLIIHFRLAKLRVFVNAFKEKGNLAAAFRLIRQKVPTIERLGMPQIIINFHRFSGGVGVGDWADWFW